MAGGYRNSGFPVEALAAVRDGLERTSVTGERFFGAELYRLQGELLADLGGDDSAARQSFVQAVNGARADRPAGLALGRNRATVPTSEPTSGHDEDLDRFDWPGSRFDWLDGGQAAWLLGLLLAGLGPVVRLVQVLDARRREIARPGTIVLVAAVSAAALMAVTAVVCRRSARKPTSVGAAAGTVGYVFFASDVFGPNPVVRLVGAAALGAVVVSAVFHRARLAYPAMVVGLVDASVVGIGYAGWRAGHRLFDETTPPDDVLADLSSVLEGANRTVDWFRSRGYRYVQTDQPQPAGAACDRTLADACLHGDRGGWLDVPGTWRVVVERTPIGPLLVGSPVAGRPELWPRDAVAAILEGGVVNSARPSFVVAQIIPPHPPYLRTTDCRETKAVGTLAEGWAARNKPFYMAQLRCARADLVQAMRQLVAADPTAVVVVQSDTGPAFDLELGASVGELTQQMTRDRFGVFRVWRLPAGCRTTDERASSLVNTFAVVQGCLTGRPPQLIDASAYLVWFDSTEVERLPLGIAFPGPG